MKKVDANTGYKGQKFAKSGGSGADFDSAFPVCWEAFPKRSLEQSSDRCVDKTGGDGAMAALRERIWAVRRFLPDRVGTAEIALREASGWARWSGGLNVWWMPVSTDMITNSSGQHQGL